MNMGQHTAVLNGHKITYRLDGNPNGKPVVFANSLGTDHHLWDAIMPLLPHNNLYLRYDKRGHGTSDCPAPPYSMGTLVRDVESLMDHLGIRDALFVGLSIGGMIAQGLAVKRLDLVRAMVLSNTAAKIGQKTMWDDRINAIETKGMTSLSSAILDRWFSKEYLQSDQMPKWKAALDAQNPQGYIGCCAAISGTDFYTPTSGLRLPTLGIAGDQDKSTPPDLVRETVDLIPGSQFELIRGSGHLPCVDNPEIYAKILTKFMKDTGHV